MKIKVWPGLIGIGLATVAGFLPFKSAFRAQDVQAQKVAQQAPPVLDAFAEADLNFRSLYAGGRAATLAKLSPLIVVEMDNLILIRDGKRTEVKVIPPLYHRLKAVSHIPLAVYVSLAPYGGGALDEKRLGALRSFRARVATVIESLDRSGFSAEQSRRSRSILDRCVTFLDGVLSAGKHDPAGLKTLTRAAAPMVLSNAADAAKAQIDAYHAQVNAWRRKVPPEEWSQLRVLVTGHQMERKHNVAVQYFAKLLDVPTESPQRLVYAEELDGVRQGLNLLATHKLDSEIAQAFFNDPDRMEIDLLGNVAADYLDRMDFGR